MDKDLVDIMEKKVVITPSKGDPYLHFDEKLYMQKAKIRMGVGLGELFEILLYLMVFFYFLIVPFRIMKQRKMAYQIYQEDCYKYVEESKRMEIKPHSKHGRLKIY